MCGYKPRHAPLVGSRLRSRSGSLAMLLAKRAGILMPRARRTQARLLLAIDTRGECPIVGVADYGTLLCSDIGRHLAVHQPLQASPWYAHVVHCGVWGTHQGRIGKRMSALWSMKWPLRAGRIVVCARRESQCRENRSR
jgi:hypothetical protein